MPDPEKGRSLENKLSLGPEHNGYRRNTFKEWGRANRADCRCRRGLCQQQPGAGRRTAEPDCRRPCRARPRRRHDGAASAEKQKPAVNPKRSVHDDYIVCLEDGKKFKSLKRHLMTHYNLTPEEYREKWGLDANYPMVAPNYAAARSQLAKKMGLGRKPKGRR